MEPILTLTKQITYQEAKDLEVIDDVVVYTGGDFNYPKVSDIFNDKFEIRPTIDCYVSFRVYYKASKKKFKASIFYNASGTNDKVTLMIEDIRYKDIDKFRNQNFYIYELEDDPPFSCFVVKWKGRYILPENVRKHKIPIDECEIIKVDCLSKTADA